MSNPTSSAELLFGYDGFKIIEVIENQDELIKHTSFPKAANVKIGDFQLSFHLIIDQL